MGIATLIAVIIAVFQVFSLMRYVSRLPDDTLGIWMHVVMIFLWVVAAILFFRNSRS
ncbi:hypothetical protein ACFL0G_04510 [Candidatus Zixiibacteriota bacterium]